MKFNKWTLGLAAVGVVSLASAARADEKMSQVQTALSNTTISGYVDTSAQWNLGSQNGGPTPAYGYGGIGKANGFNLNAVDIALDKPEDAGSWASGYHVELMDGPDNPIAAGNTLSIRQAYVVLRTPAGANGIDWKVGVWDTIIGYEGTSDPTNPNFTRSYGYSIEPTTHTGILGTYKINDEATVSFGVADSSNVGGFAPAALNGRAAFETEKAYMASLALTAPASWGWAKGATLTLGGINADSGPGLFGGGSTSLYAGVTVPTPIAALKFGAAFDYLDEHDGNKIVGAGANSSDDSVWVAGLYGTYQATDKLSFNLRGEYLKDGENHVFGDALPATYAVAGAAEEFTATVQYALWANVLSRVEFRWDHVEHGNAFDAPAAGGAPVHSNAYLLALNLIYQF
jgi:hypothetical protein